MGYMYPRFRKIKDKLTTTKTTKSIYHIGVFYQIHLKENYIYPPHFDGGYSVISKREYKPLNLYLINYSVSILED